MSDAKPRPSSPAEFEALKQRRPKMAPPYIPVKAEIFRLQLDPYAYRLYLHLFGLAAENWQNWCRISKRELAEQTGIGHMKVHTALKLLEKQGLITSSSSQGLNHTEFVIHEPWLAGGEASLRGGEASLRGGEASLRGGEASLRGGEASLRGGEAILARVRTETGNTHTARVCAQAQLPPSLQSIPQGTLDGWAERYGAMRLLGVLVTAAGIPGIRNPGGIVRTLLTDGSGLDEFELISLLRSNLARAAGAAGFECELQELQVGTPGGEQRAAPGPGQTLQGIWEAFQVRFPGQGLAWLAFWGQEATQATPGLTWLDLPEGVRTSFSSAPEEEKQQLVDWYRRHPEKLDR